MCKEWGDIVLPRSLQSPSSPCYLLYGDVSGSVVILTFHKPTMALFITGQIEDDNSPKLIPFSVSANSSIFGEGRRMVKGIQPHKLY